MKAPSLILIFMLLGLMIVLAALHRVSLQHQKNTTRIMERAMTDLTQRANAAETELKGLRLQLARTQSELAVAARAVQEAASTPPPAAPKTNEVGGLRSASPQAFQARAYVGKDYLGMAWVIPSNIKEASEGFQFEPVIWIDERSRRTFTQTNIVEREVVRNNSYTEVYQQPYWYGYPVWTFPSSSRPDTPPARPPVQLPSPGPGGGGGPWSPVVGPAPQTGGGAAVLPRRP